MDVYLCEKPSQGRDLAAVLGVNQRGNGYLHDGGNRAVTWAVGHILEMFNPDEYDDKYKSWALDVLPIIPDKWRFKVKSQTADQYKAIQTLLKKAKCVYISTDYDREGEAIARQLLDRVNYSGEIKRVCLRALDEKSIRKALQEVKPGSESLPLYHASIARQRADWLVGMNLTRLYTSLGRQLGAREAIQVGRVITPTVALVCDRDAEIKRFKPSPFYILHAMLAVQNGTFMATWQPPEDMADEHGRCIHKTFAEQVRQQIDGKPATIDKAETKAGSETAPLPFDLSSLQQYASRRWGYTADQVLQTAQSLYETHKASTYPRTDSRYLPESQRGDASSIFQALMRSDQRFSGIVAGADVQQKCRAFNDSKVTAHHAIIPTSEVVDTNKMNEAEANIYDAIRRYYMAQFYAPCTFEKTEIVASCEKHCFIARGKVPKQEGWKIIFAGIDEGSTDDEKDDKDDAEAVLPPIREGEPASVRKVKLNEKMTRPPPRFTEATLLGAMENIARFVDEPKFKQILKETAGLGTPATRAATIQGAVDKGYLVRKKKVVESTDKARAMVAIVPKMVRSPGLTAAWEQELEKIATGEIPMTAFNQHITQWVSKMTTQAVADADSITRPDSPVAPYFAKLKGPTYPCFDCGSEMVRRKSKRGFFWACQSPACKATHPDNKGKPQKRKQRIEGPQCGECGSVMLLREVPAKGKKKASRFWGCSNYPKCKQTSPFVEE